MARTSKTRVRNEVKTVAGTLKRNLPIAKKTYKGNVKLSVPPRHSTRVPKEIQRFTESIPTRSPKRPSRNTTKERVNTGNNKGPNKKTRLGKGPRRVQDKDVSNKKRSKNDRLVPRPQIEVTSQNNLLFGTTNPKAVSERTYARIAHRFVRMKDVPGLKAALKDRSKVHSCTLMMPYCKADDMTPEGYAVLSEDVKFMDEVLKLNNTLQQDANNGGGTATFNNSLLSSVGTGNQNSHMLGHRTAQIEMTRGGKEGNNALVKHEVDKFNNISRLVPHFMASNVSFTTLEHLSSLKFDSSFSNLKNSYGSHVVDAVRYGNRKLAGKIIEAYVSYDYNDLHKQTLLNDKQTLRKFKSVSVLKKGGYRGSSNITPLHTAAINPNVAYLKALVAVEPSFNIPDSQNWYTIHYAAVCEEAGPLKLLLSMGTPWALLNKSKESPLHCAAKAGRFLCVKVLLEAIKESEDAREAEQQRETQSGREREDSLPPAKKARLELVKKNASMVNAKAKDGQTPLHMAVHKGHKQVVQVLLACPSVNVDAVLSANKMKLTPLMVAARRGFKEILDELIDVGGAVVERGDKLKRTALMHACMNGQMHVMSDLIRRGASVLVSDSSGNSCAHYAAAYGWLECLELLCEVDPSCLSANNDWHLTPLAVAYLKGHIGVVEWMLSGPHNSYVSVNCCDQAGISLLSSVLNCYSTISSNDLIKQLQYLASKGVDCSLKDTSMNSTLHYLASKPVILKISDDKLIKYVETGNDARLTLEGYISCVRLLIDNGASINDKNENGCDALQLALKNHNVYLVEYLFDILEEDGMNIKHLNDRTVLDEDHNNILHHLLTLPFQVRSAANSRTGASADEYNIMGLLNKLMLMSNRQVITWLNAKNKSGRTPFMALCQQFGELRDNRNQYDKELDDILVNNNRQFVKSMCDVVKVLANLDCDILLQTSDKSGAKFEKGGNKAYTNDSDSDESENSEDNEEEDDANNQAIKIEEERQFEFSTVLDIALQGCDIDMGNELVARFPVNGQTYTVDNPLLVTVIECAKQGALIKKLLSQRNATDRTALLSAVESGNISTSLYLMNLDSDIHFDTIHRVWNKDTNKYVPCNKTVMMCALEKRLFEVVKELDLTKNEWNATTLKGKNAFHLVSDLVSADTIHYFNFINGKQVQFKADNEGRYPLHIAVDAIRNGGTDVFTEPVEWLLINSPGLHYKDKLGKLPLHYALVSALSNETNDMDPIAVVSILEQAMDKHKLYEPDNLGNTPLHYAAQIGANVCAVTLLRYGANSNARNKEGNTPLGVAVRSGHQACTLTLIQAKSDVLVPICTIKKPENSEENPWVWVPDRNVPEVLEFKSTVASIVVRNGWQGIIYMILDIIGKNETTLGELLMSALEHRTYNLSLTLMRMLDKVMRLGDSDSVQRKMALVNNMNIFDVFARNQSSNVMDNAVANVLNELLSTGIEWYSKDSNGKLISKPFEIMALKGLFNMLDRITEWDLSSAHSKYASIQYPINNENPLVGCIEYWIMSGESADLKRWVLKLGEKFGMNTLMEYEESAIVGMMPWRSNRPMKKYSMMTPLIRAIQARCISLVKFLLQEPQLETDVNQGDASGLTPLMHACIVNSDECVSLLFSPFPQKLIQKPIQTKGRKRKAAEKDLGTRFGGFIPVNSASEDDTTSNENAQTSTVPERPSISLTSSLDVKRTIRDKDNRDITVLHCMVQPCAWENTKLLESICSAVDGITHLIDYKGNRGISPLTMARNLYQPSMVAVMEKLCKAKPVAIKRPSVDISNIMAQHDINADSEEFLKKDADSKRALLKREPDKKERKPHKNSGYRDTGEICVMKLDGSDEQVLYKVLLNKTDVSFGTHGFHNFYRMELVQRKGSELYVLFTNWGRIGDREGQFQRTPFSSFADACKEFGSVFRAKTGNDFNNINSFKPVDNKYRLLKLDSSSANDIGDMKIELDTWKSLDKVESDPVYKFIRDISNVERLQHKTRSVSSYSRLNVPFGRLSRNDLMEGRKILNKALVLVKDMEKLRQKDKPNVDDILRVARLQAANSNYLYRLVPLGGYETNTLPVLEDEYTISQFSDVIADLLEFEIAGRVVTAAANKKDVIDPYNYILNAIECELCLLEPDSVMSQHILQYIQTSSDCKVAAIYRVKSKEATRLFNENALHKPNHRYLWHGTKPENLLSILKLGLLPTPASAIQTGQAFGKGIYFADMFSKSAQYCQTSAGGLQYTLLCQVAMGRVKQVFGTSEQNANNYDTLHVVGREYPDPHFDITLQDGAVMPLGQNKCLDYYEFHKKYGSYHSVNRNEYVVKDKSLTAVKYIVAFQ